MAYNLVFAIEETEVNGQAPDFILTRETSYSNIEEAKKAFWKAYEDATPLL